jgi:predicted nucleic acid-binding protein
VEALDEAAAAQWAGYSAITRLELFGYPNLRPADGTALRSLLGCFNEVEVSARVVDKAIELRQKRRIRVPDAIIAASALVTGATLITRNATDFKAIPGLDVVNPIER